MFSLAANPLPIVDCNTQLEELPIDDSSDKKVYTADIIYLPTPEGKETTRLALVYQAEPSEENFMLLKNNVNGLIWSYVNIYAPPTSTQKELDDYYQVGVAALLMAVNKFDRRFINPNTGETVQFSTYFTSWLQNFIIDEVRINDPLVLSKYYWNLKMQLDKRVYEFEKKHHRTPTPQELKQIYHDVGLSEQAIPKLSSIYVNGDSEDEDRNLLNNLQTPRNSAEEAMRFTQSQEKIIFILSQLKKIEKIKYLIDTYIIHVTAKLNSSHSAKQKIELNGKEVFVGYGTQQHLAFLFGVSQQAINSRIKRVQKMIMWAMETPGLNKENFVKKLTENFELK